MRKRSQLLLVIFLFLIPSLLLSTFSLAYNSSQSFTATAKWGYNVVAAGMTEVPIEITVTNDGPNAVGNVTVYATPSYPFCGYINSVFVSDWQPGQSITLVGYLNISPSASLGDYNIQVYVTPLNYANYVYYETTAEVAINGYVNISVQSALISNNHLSINLINTGNVESGPVYIYFYNTSLVRFFESYEILPSIQPEQSIQVTVPIELDAPPQPGVYIIPMKLVYMRGIHEIQTPVIIPSNTSIVFSLTGNWVGKYATISLIYSSPYNVSAVRIIGQLPLGVTNFTGGSEIYVTVPLTSVSGIVKFNIYLDSNSSPYLIPVELEWFTNKGIITQKGYLSLYIYNQPNIEVVSIEGILYAGLEDNITITVKNIGNAPAYNLTASENTIPIISSTTLPYLAPGKEGKITILVYTPFSEEGKSITTNITISYMTLQGIVNVTSISEAFTIYQPIVPIVVSDPGLDLIAGIDNTINLTFTNNLGETIYDLVINITPSEGSVIGSSQIYIKSLLVGESASIPIILNIPSTASNTLSITVSMSYLTPSGTESSYTTTLSYQVESLKEISQEFEVSISPSVVEYGNLSSVQITISSFFNSPILDAVLEVSSPNGYVSPSIVPIQEISPFSTVTKDVNIEFAPPSNGSSLLEPINVTLRFYYEGAFLNFTRQLKILAIGKPLLLISGLSYAVVEGNTSEVTTSVSFLVGDSGSASISSVTIVPLPPSGITLIEPSVVGVSDLKPSESQAVSFTVVGKPGNYTIPLHIIYTTPLGQEVTETYNIQITLTPPSTSTTTSIASPVDILLQNPLFPVVIVLIIIIILLVRKVEKR
ncbi:hypothetical protein [Sulfurisphaera ohwakuensis]|uniref:S-layer protein n=1 Tax=Sulfurisphaera ohwakuensis TaxID=69656 RepID=A0A650CDS4_SULOH|nr:hypothetical protein [Sulfurisphaera ohwakuensis]MBB5253088.1 hypothetical protein [Sulfurisphaera ohwakuensis]QGR15990.1 hypothetical protein D1869_01425 [Sulfurisphaera ohwakuensis]